MLTLPILTGSGRPDQLLQLQRFPIMSMCIISLCTSTAQHTHCHVYCSYGL